MANFYKNTCGSTINIPMFGLGVVHIPADAACIELEKHVAEAINDMARPNIILEEVFPKITVDASPVVTKDHKKKAKQAEDVPEVEEAEPAVEAEIEDVTL